MMTQQLGVSILSAPLAALDRRALSQAWFSALHLARESVHPAASEPSVPPRSAPAIKSTDSETERPHARSTSDGPPSTARESDSKRPAHMSAAADRRASRSPLARRIERTFLDPRANVKRATFSVGEEGVRVHVVLQSRGERVHLVALCAPRVRDTVVQALAQARYALASRGIVIDVEAKGEEACS